MTCGNDGEKGRRLLVVMDASFHIYGGDMVVADDGVR